MWGREGGKEERRRGGTLRGQGRAKEGRKCVLPGNDKQHTTDTQASQQNIHPDIGRERVEEGEHPRVGSVGFAVENTYPQRHKGLGEVNDLLAHIGDGQGSNCQVGFLHRKREKQGKVHQSVARGKHYNKSN